jgi:hypothetical protein
VEARTLTAIAVARAITDHAGAEVWKGWRDRSAGTPHADYDLPLTDHYTPLIQAGLRALWTDRELIEAVKTGSHLAPLAPILAKASAAHTLTNRPHQIVLIASAAKGFLRHVGARVQALLDPIRLVYADGWLAGAHAAQLQTGGTVPAPIGDILDQVDWATWEPGNAQAAAKVTGGGLGDLLAQADTRIKGITGSLLDRIGDRIGVGLLNGEPIAEIAAALAALVDDPYRAAMIAHTEVSRAMHLASLDVYQANGIDQWDWVTQEDPCPDCADQEDTNPHGPGDNPPPIHPWDRCSTQPHT